MLTLSILTPQKVVFEEDVYSINVPGADGYLEILAHHAPITALLKPGRLVIVTKENKRLVYAVTSGFLEVSNNQAKVIVDAIEAVAEIDSKRAQMAYERAQARLESGDSHVDLERAKRALERAQNRLKLAEESDTSSRETF